MKKRLLTFILSCVMLISILPSAALAKSGTVDTNAYADAYALMSKIGVDAEEEYNSENITRYAFIKIMVNVFEKGGWAFADNDVIFKDVKAGSEAETVLNKAVGANLVTGDGNGLFRPNENININEALTISLNALGYNKLNGAVSYRNIPTKVRKALVKNLSTTAGYITYGDAYIMIYNTLNQDIVEEGYSQISKKFTTTEGNTLLYLLHRIRRTEGILVADEVMHIEEDRYLDADEYEIYSGGVSTVYTAEAEEDDYTDLIGMSVYAYYREDGDKLVYMTPTEDNDSFEIAGDNVLCYNYTTKKLEYNEEITESAVKSSFKKKTVEVPTSIDIVYNSYFVYDNSVVFQSINDAVNYVTNLNIRRIKFLDNNNDGTYDVMFVNMYENYFVEKISTSGVASDFYTKNTIDLSGDDDIKTFLRNDRGELIDFTSIAKSSVLSIERDINKNKVVTAFVTDMSFEGVLDKQHSDDDGYYFTVNGEELKIANGDYYKSTSTPGANYMDYIAKIYNTVRASEKYTYYVDICGKIVAVNSQNTVYQFGYVLKARSMDDEEKTLKICVPDDSQNGYSLTTYDIRRKIRIDDATYQEPDYDFTRLEYKLVRFKVNSSNELVEIDTPSATPGKNVFSYVNYQEANGPIVGTYRPNWSSISQNDKFDRKIGVNLGMDDNTIILIVPKNSSVPDGELAITRLHGNQRGTFFTDWKQYEANGYITDENDMTCAVVTTYLDVTDSSADKAAFEKQQPMVVDKIYTGLNRDGEVCDVIEGMMEGSRISFASADRHFLNYGKTTVADIKRGDILKVKLDWFGEGTHVQKLYNAETDTYGALAYSINPTSTRMVLGTVYATNGNHFTFVEKDNPRTQEYAERFTAGGDCKVYVYDGTEKSVRLGNHNDITSDPNTRVVISSREAIYLRIVVYKNMPR